VIGAVACWWLTAARPGRRSTGRTILAIAVRTLAVLNVGLTLTSIAMDADYATTAGRMVLYVSWAASIVWPVAQLAYFRSLFVEVGDPRGARFAFALALVFGALQASQIVLSSWLIVQLALGTMLWIRGVQLL
jgi:hypothetical protein